MDFKGAQMQPMGHLKSIVFSRVCCVLCILRQTVNVAAKPKEHDLYMDFKGAQMQQMGHLKTTVFCRVLHFLAAGLLKNAFRASIRKYQKNVQFGTPPDHTVLLRVGCLHLMWRALHGRPGVI